MFDFLSSAREREPEDRRTFYRHVIFKPMWLAVIAVFSLLSNSDTISEKLIKSNVSPETWKNWEWLTVTGNWHFYVWIIGALVIMLIGSAESGYRLYRSARQREQSAVTELMNAIEPRLEILWHPGENVYYSEFPGQPVASVHFRIGIRNLSKTTSVNGIRVLLNQLTPHLLPCVPCSLRLMNNILVPPDSDPRIERFSLNPGDTQFIDLMEQKTGSPAFNIWHTVVPQISTQVPVRAYTMKILVTASDAPSVSKGFELIENGPTWNLRAL